MVSLVRVLRLGRLVISLILLNSTWWFPVAFSLISRAFSRISEQGCENAGLRPLSPRRPLIAEEFNFINAASTYTVYSFFDPASTDTDFSSITLPLTLLFHQSRVNLHRDFLINFASIYMVIFHQSRSHLHVIFLQSRFDLHRRFFFNTASNDNATLHGFSRVCRPPLELEC